MGNGYFHISRDHWQPYSMIHSNLLTKRGEWFASRSIWGLVVEFINIQPTKVVCTVYPKSKLLNPSCAILDCRIKLRESDSS